MSGRASHDLSTRFTLRWRKVWQSEDGRGSVQRYRAPYGLTIFDAYLDKRHLGSTHRMITAKKLVTEAMAVK